jgi:hypothetical protein
MGKPFLTMKEKGLAFYNPSLAHLQVSLTINGYPNRKGSLTALMQMPGALADARRQSATKLMDVR